MIRKWQTKVHVAKPDLSAAAQAPPDLPDLND